MENRLTFTSTPYANTSILVKLKELGVEQEGMNVSIGDIILLLNLKFDIIIYIITPTEQNNNFEFLCQDQDLNTNFFNKTFTGKLTTIQLNLIIYKCLQWLLCKQNKTIPETVESYKFETESIEILKESFK